MPNSMNNGGRSSLMMGLIAGVWGFAHMVWPVLNFLILADLVLRFGSMLYHWHDASSHAGATFLFHFLGAIGINYFLFQYKPRVD